MSAASSDGDRYLVAAFLQACQVMDAFHKPNEILRLKDVVARTGLPKGTAFRLLYTLDNAGFVEKTGRISTGYESQCPSGAGIALAMT